MVPKGRAVEGTVAWPQILPLEDSLFMKASMMGIFLQEVKTPSGIMLTDWMFDRPFYLFRSETCSSVFSSL